MGPFVVEGEQSVLSADVALLDFDKHLMARHWAGQVIDLFRQ